MTSGRTLDTKPDNSDVGFVVPVDLEKITLNYLRDSDDTATYTYNSGLSFFANVSNLAHSQAAFAARHILAGNPWPALILVKQNPTILSCTITAEDRWSREVSGTLLQIAARAGDFNIPLPYTKTKIYNHCLVEQISHYYQDPEKVSQELGAVFPPNWEIEMEKKTMLIFDVLCHFSKNITKLNEIELTQINQLKNQRNSIPLVDEFQKSLLTLSKEIGKTGYIFDPRIFYAAIRLFIKNIDRFGGWHGKKSDLFWVHGFGSLQNLAMACDLQIFNKGIYQVIHQGLTIDRDFDFFKEQSSYLTSLGSIFYYDIFGKPNTQAHGMLRLIHGSGSDHSISYPYRNLSRAKLAAQQNLYSKINRKPNPNNYPR